MGLVRLKLRRTGNSLSTIWPKEVLARLNVQEGDQLYALETLHGVMVTPYDPAFEETMEAARKVMARDRDALRALSKR